MITRRKVFRTLAVSVLLAATPAAVRPFALFQSSLDPEVSAALDRISSDSLRGHLEFIASDLLEGRNTPSRGLDIAAEYIAAQFRRAGLEPVGDDGYFQVARFLVSERDMTGFRMKLEDGDQTANLVANQVSFSFQQRVILSSAAVLKLDLKDPTAFDALQPESAAGKAMVAEIPDVRAVAPADRAEALRAQMEIVNRISALKPALVLSIDRNNPVGNGGGAGRLIDPETRPNPAPANAAPALPVVTIQSRDAIAMLDALPAGATAMKVSADLPPITEREVRLRNVVGLLRGSDPVLKDTYVLLTAHYDHIGTRAGTGDTIFNGANDDGSGTVSVIEIGSALASLHPQPKRTIVFMTVFGEEKGLLGSRYYGRHPIFPVAQTVADLNLEQVGRTDSTEGPQINNASMTGFDFSELGQIFEKAGEETGIMVYKHQQNSDSYFGRSDNQALADLGVPAHTLCVAYNYPDYHGVGDHADKVDYVNMAKVDRTVALGLVMISNNPEAPKWNEANPRTARYVSAWKALHGQ